MYTNAICPISNQQINERVARINAVITLSVTVLAIATGAPWLLALMVIDFFLRAFGFQPYSPVARLSAWFVGRFGLGVHKVNAGPKIFAARIGFIFSLLVVVFALIGWQGAALSLAAVLGFCAFLEGAFGFCVACAIYPLVFRWVQ